MPLAIMALAGVVLVPGCDASEVSPPVLQQLEQPLDGCVTATQNQTQAAVIATQTGVFEAAWDVTPASGADSGIGFSPLSSPSGWTSMATIVRFSGGVIDVRDYDQYRADVPMSWTAGSSYSVRMIVDVPAKTYSVFVKGPTGNEQTLATNYRFRSEQSSATQLVRSVVTTGTTGSITACGPAISSCVTATAGTTINTGFTSQRGSFSASWDMTPLSASIDAAVALAPSTAASDWTDLATIVRFATSPSSLIDARNGASYAHAVTIPWAVNGNYRIRLDVNVTTHTYSISVTAPNGSEQTLGSGYAFRTEQSSAQQLASWVVKSSTGSARACNFKSTGSGSTYNSVVLADNPVAFWGMTGGGSTETDLSGNGRTGTYVGRPTTTTMPNGDTVAVFDGASQYLSVASHASLSIPTTHNFTWEAWIKPTTLEFPNPTTGNYVDFMGKCDQYAPTCEWEARMYNNSHTRCDRLSAYVFNPSAGFGAGADWQPSSCSHLVAGHWYHVVGEYTTSTTNQPPDCDSAYPGSINIWVNGVPWDQSYHGDTGCMSQYDISPVANNSTLQIGTMAEDSWFQGAIGKVAIYNYLLTQSQIDEHYETMTSLSSNNGSCDDTCTLAVP